MELIFPTLCIQLGEAYFANASPFLSLGWEFEWMKRGQGHDRLD